MPYLVVKFPQSIPMVSIDINFGMEGLSRVAIHSFQVSGLAANLPFFLQIKNQPTGGIYGNTQSSFGYPMLPNGINSTVQLENPIVVTEGDNVWNNAHRLDFEVHDYTGALLAFTELCVVFELLVRDPFNTREQPPHDFQRYIESKQTSTRNNAPLPSSFYSDAFSL